MRASRLARTEGACTSLLRSISPMFTWRKLAKVFTPQEVAGRDWLKEFAQAPATLLFDDFVRVYFSCRPGAGSEGRYVSYSGYVDLDRSNLFKVLHVADRAVLASSMSLVRIRFL